MRVPIRKKTVAFVLGGGGHPGAIQVGMLRALVERGIRPDLVLGTSVGAVNGVAIAAKPTIEGVDALEGFWGRIEETGVFGGSLITRLGTLARRSLSSPVRQVGREFSERPPRCRAC